VNNSIPEGVLDDWQRCQIIVAGDLMLDEYVYGNAVRLSPDAPVPVVKTVREESRLGGAANVALCIRSLGCDVTCLGFVGDDRAGDRLVSMLEVAGCNTEGVIVVPGRTTTVKQSVIGLAQHRHAQKMFRIDREQTDPPPAKHLRQMLQHARRALRTARILCIEDYDKGALPASICRSLIDLARPKGVMTIVDPAAVSDYRQYEHATMVTPNRSEVMLATGTPRSSFADIRFLSQLGRRLLRSLHLDSIVMTLDKEGALLLERARRPVLVPTRARQVYDVTGAGDVFVAALTCALGNSLPRHTAVQLANLAAGLKVERFGVTPIELHEVRTAIHRETSDHRGKLRQLDELLAELIHHRNEGKRIVFTNGCFDILHSGHISLLRFAKTQGDILIVGLNDDASIRRLKGVGRPINKSEQRIATLSEVQCVDHLLMFDADTPLDLIKAIRPDVLVKGADYKESKVVGGKYVASYGGRLALAPVVKGQSTTSILRKIES